MRDARAAAAVRLVPALLVASLALAVTGSTPGLSSAQSCAEASAYEQAGGGTPGGGESLPPVPLVIHIMERPEHPCEVRRHWTPAQVTTVFGPRTDDPRGVNSVWGPTRIRFHVREVLLHPFPPPDGMLESIPAGPRGKAAFEAKFKSLVTKFHRVGAVNVYLWELIPGFPMGFGRSPRTGNGKATVWLDKVCVDTELLTPERCARAAAHELGHALGLYHSGPGTCAPVQARYRKLCQKLAAPCAESQADDRLMTAENGLGRKLCPVEQVEAERMATKLK